MSLSSWLNRKQKKKKKKMCSLKFSLLSLRMTPECSCTIPQSTCGWSQPSAEKPMNRGWVCSSVVTNFSLRIPHETTDKLCGKDFREMNAHLREWFTKMRVWAPACVLSSVCKFSLRNVSRQVKLDSFLPSSLPSFLLPFLHPSARIY